jgi:hypothetical protein|tara:strand:+ start:509 stop:1294 length:786 start_codon:yes stop_codon:yes gene_type:complete
MAEQETADQPVYDPVDAIDPEKQIAEEVPAAPKSAYAEKSRDELEKMLDDQKSMIGRQSNEVSDVRREIDSLKSQVSAQSFVDGQMKQPEQAESKEIDYFGDPKGAVNQVVDNHPALRQTQEELVRLKAENAAMNLQAKHPDADQILSSAEFKQWVSQSPSYTEGYAHGMKNLNVPILDELVSKYKAAHTDPEVEQLKTQDRKQQVRQAATGSTQGSGEKAPGKTLTREDMVNLQVTDPDRYWRLYAQGKIKDAYRTKIKK